MQGQASVLYYQPDAATPSERVLAAAHRERIARMERAAVPEVVTEVRIVPEQAPEPEPSPKTNEEIWTDWADRQRAAFKEPWFRIVDEIDPFPEPRRIRIEEVQRAVESVCGITHEELLCARRTAKIVRPRQVAMYLAKTLTLRSLPEIGRRFGGRDHTTVLHAVRKIERQRLNDPELQADLEAITARLTLTVEEHGQ